MIYLKDILDHIEYNKFFGNPDVHIEKVIKFNSANEDKNVLMWVNEVNFKNISSSCKGTIICSALPAIELNPNANYIIVKNPRGSFRIVLEKFFIENEVASISETCRIHELSKIGVNVSIGHYVVIEKDCEIGDNSLIGHNSVILKGTKIGSNVTIGNNTTIGGIGFGYEKDNSGMYKLIPHLGNVVINDYAEIGDNTVIDRAVLGSTIIGRNVKIDNHVHIAHGVEIGENSLIIANSMIAGSSKIGKNVWVAPSSSILNKIDIGDDAFIGMGSVVLQNVKEYDKVFGNPAKPILSPGSKK